MSGAGGLTATIAMSAPYRPAIRHRGPCGPRRRCYREACRAEFGDFATVEILGRVALFFCHGSHLPADSITHGMLP